MLLHWYLYSPCYANSYGPLLLQLEAVAVLIHHYDNCNQQVPLSQAVSAFHTRLTKLASDGTNIPLAVQKTTIDKCKEMAQLAQQTAAVTLYVVCR